MKNFYVFLFFVLSFFGTKGYAAEYYWVGSAGNSNYNTLQNWRLGSTTGATPTVIPSANDNVYFTDGANSTTVSFNQSSIVFNNFTVSAVTKNYEFSLTALSGATKTLTINGILDLSARATFTSSATSGNEQSIGTLIINKSPKLSQNVFKVFLKFDKTNELIKPTTGFEAQGIYVENGVRLDLSNLTIKVKQFTNTNAESGLVKISSSNTILNFSNTILECSKFWIKDYNNSNSSFNNLDLKINGGSISKENHITFPIVATPSNGPRGLVVEKNNLTLPKVTFQQLYNTNKESTIAANNLSIGELKVQGTVLFFDTSNLNVTNLTLDKGIEYTFYGTSTTTTPSTLPNVKVAQFKFNPSTSGTTRFSTYNTKFNNTLALLDIPAASTPSYDKIVANGIYSKIPVVFSNSILENDNVNINVTSTSEINYYWRGDGDGKTWTMLTNWSLSPSAINVPSTLPSMYDNVYFNGNSTVSGTIVLNNITDIHDFIVEPSFIGRSFEIESNSEINPFIIRGSLQLQANTMINAKKLIFVPTSRSISTPETITLNNGFIYKVNVPGTALVTGGGVLSLRGDKFEYFNSSDPYNSKFIFQNGTLIFDTPNVDFAVFDGNLESDTNYKIHLYLKNANVNVKSWVYNNKGNVNGGRYFLDAGTSTISYSITFTAADSNSQSVDNSLQYNNVTLLKTSTTSNPMLSGIYKIRNLELRNNANFFTQAGSLFYNNPTYYNVINNLRVVGGNSYQFSTYNNVGQLRMTFVNKFITENTGSCNLVTNFVAESPNVILKLLNTLTDASGVNNQLTLDGYDIRNIKFDKVANYNLYIKGAVNAETSGYTSVVTPTANNLYWIGSPSNQNWHDQNNWTINANGTPNLASCSPTKFDNAHFKSYSNQYSNELRFDNDVHINTIIFENDSPQGMIFISPAGRDVYLYGSMYLNNNVFNGVNRILGYGTFDSPTYDNTPRHKIQSKGSKLNLRINLLDKSFYKLVDDYVNNSNGIYMLGSADLDASNINVTLQSITTNSNILNGPTTSGKINFDNSRIQVGNQISGDTSSFKISANNASFRFTSNNAVLKYLNSSNTNGVNTDFQNATIEFTSSNSSANTITGTSSNALEFNTITTRGNALILTSSVTTKTLNSISNKIQIEANKEFKILQNAYLSGSACDITRSVVSSVSGQRAKLTIGSGNTNFDYLTIKDIDANSSYQPLIFGTYSTNGGNNTSFVQFLTGGSDNSTYGFGAVYACRDLETNQFLSADGFYPNNLSTFKWYKISGENSNETVIISTEKDINLSQFGYGTYRLEINYDPSNTSSCTIIDEINITPTPTKPSELLDDKFCKSRIVTLGDIQLDGSELIWYETATSTTPLAVTTPIVSGNTYFVTRKYDSGSGISCESEERLQIEIKLDVCGGVYLNPVLRLRTF